MEKRTNPRISLSSVRTTKEKWYLTLSVVLAVLGWLWIFQPLFTVLSEQSTDMLKILSAGLGPLLFVGFFFLSLFLHFLSLGYIRMNGIKISKDQFPHINQIALNISHKLGLRNQPDIFVLNGNGVLNAFATKLTFRKVVVVYSDLADVLIADHHQEQLTAVLAHELGHQALLHTSILLEFFLAPAFIVPFLRNALSRAREYSADQAMAKSLSDKEAGVRALLKLAAGGKAGQSAHLEPYLRQIQDESGFYAWYAEVLSSHPFLPKRIKAIL